MTEYFEFWKHDNPGAYWFCPVMDYRGDDDDFERMLRRCRPPSWEEAGPVEDIYLASPRALVQLFTYMRTHDIPALEPDSLAVLVRLLRAGVRIISRQEVNP
jgi:hypothetical protein